MLAPLYSFLTLLVIHWVADFILQTHWQASNKSKNNIALFRHVFVYTIVLFFATPFIFTDPYHIGDYALYDKYLLFTISNGVLHFITDWCTSRLTSRLYAKGDIHNFFVVVGFDQLIHQFGYLGKFMHVSEQACKEIDAIIDVDASMIESIRPLNNDVDNFAMLIHEGKRKIEAIKAYRTLTGYGLKESKDFVERYWPVSQYKAAKEFRNMLLTSLSEYNEPGHCLDGFTDNQICKIEDYINSFEIFA